MNYKDLISNNNPIYFTNQGAAFVGDSLELISQLKDESVSLVMTSPPFALLRQKEYGNQTQELYVDWLVEFGKAILPKLKPDGSFVIDLGGAYERGKPTRSLYNFKVPIRFVEELGYYLAEDFYWFNPSKLPSPIEWVNKRKIRAKDSVNNVWWFSKNEFPKADVSKVLAPYSDRMNKLIQDPDKYYKAKKRPSGHDIGESFGKDNGGSIPSNLLQIPNSESNSKYMSYCKKLSIQSHPARFPSKLPKFFIEFLTDKDDLVIDIFAGSNTTGEVCEKIDRKWLAFDLSKEYLSASAFRFIESESSDNVVKSIYEELVEKGNVDLTKFMLF
jgi:site-specific DNA-methyltransferase (cytosine-N4-specific)